MSRIVAAALAVLVIVAGALPASALCIGTGGHVALEAVHADCCDPVVGGAEGRRITAASCGSHCTDTLLAFSGASAGAPGATALAMALAWLLVVLAPPTGRSSSGLLLTSLVHDPTPLRFLRTTIIVR